MLDLDFVRAQFPALDTPWTLMDNAGGSVPCRQVIDRVRAHMERLPVQLGASYPASVEAGAAVEAGRGAAASLLGAAPDETILGPSSTALVTLLANALRANWQEGDEVIVTNLDHEANIGPWRKLEASGIVIREWPVRPETLDLHLEDLEPLLGKRTRLVAFTHCSNVVGSIVDVPSIAKRIRAAGALSCVDGVAFAPHRRIDVKALGVDFYLASLYKVYGPHLGMMYGDREQLLKAKGANHFFVPEDSVPYKFEPGNVSYELAASLVGILDYLEVLGAHHGSEAPVSLEASYEHIARHEVSLVSPLLSFLAEHPKTQLVGRPDPDSELRVPTVSFTVEGRPSSDIPARLEQHRIAARFGDFYAKRLIHDLGLEEREGVVRVSLVHYNSPAEVTGLIEALDRAL